ncbi:MAG TPA: 7TM diverse intracellular signaling domain-containing protein [Spirochaetota bacterium]|nr:7TM diverse intracellular signaling domain-containing protein [Spirochaetota bacterium]
MICRKTVSLKILIFVITLLYKTAVSAMNPIVLNGTEETLNMGKFCQTLEDKNGTFTVDAVTSGQFDNSFMQSKSNIPNFGFTKSTYWCRFTLKNASPEELKYLFEIGFPLLDTVEVYGCKKTSGIDNEILYNYKTGRDFPFSSRAINHRNFITPFTIAANSELTFYLKIKTDDGMIFPLKLWKESKFSDYIQNENFLFGIYYGIILVMILYNLFIFVSTRDKNYLLYIVYITSFGMFQLAMNGLAFKFLWPENLWIAKHANPFFIGLSCLFAGLFSIHFLDLKKWTPFFAKAMTVLIFLGGILAISSLIVPYIITIIAGQILPLAMILLAIPAAAVSMLRGNRYARFYLIAWTTFFIGVIFSTLRVMGLLPHNVITEHGLQIGSGFEMVLLSIALADRINILKKEKEETQMQLINAQQEMVDYLNKSKAEIEEAHRELLLSEEKYRVLVEGTSDIIFTLDEDLNFISVNKSIATELKIDPSKINGLNFFDLLYENKEDKAETQISRLIVQEKISEFLKTKEPTQFRAQFISSIITEPKEMNVQLEYINIAGKNEILGKAYSVIDDALMKYFISEKQKYAIGNYLITADEITHRITRNLRKYMNTSEIKILQLALREIIINAIEHGNLEISFEEKTQALLEEKYFDLIRERQFHPGNINKKVTIEYSITPDKAIYIISDEGQGFNHSIFLQESTAFNTNESLLSHGRGITLTKNAFDVITYNAKGNHVMLVKKFSQ